MISRMPTSSFVAEESIRPGAGILSATGCELVLLADKDVYIHPNTNGIYSTPCCLVIMAQPSHTPAQIYFLRVVIRIDVMPKQTSIESV